MAVTVLAPSEDSGRVTPTLKTGRRRLAVQPAPGKVDVDQEPPSPLSHRGILARHATFAPRSEAEKAFGSPIPVSPGARAPPVDAASPRPQRAKPTKNTPTQPRRKFSFPKMGFFSSKTKPRDSTSGQGSPGPRRGPLALRRADALLAPRDPSDPRITLVLDLDETLYDLPSTRRSRPTSKRLSR